MADETSQLETDRAVWFAGVTPILRVSNFDTSIDYYVRILGFELDWSDGRFGSVTRGKASLMLCEGSRATRGHGCGSP